MMLSRAMVFDTVQRLFMRVVTTSLHHAEFGWDNPKTSVGWVNPHGVMCNIEAFIEWPSQLALRGHAWVDRDEDATRYWATVQADELVDLWSQTTDLSGIVQPPIQRLHDDLQSRSLADLDQATRLRSRS